MLFLIYVGVCIAAYLIFWHIGFLIIKLPGLGLGYLLMHFSSKGGGILKKVLLVPLGFLSYVLNFTLLAYFWGITMSFITLYVMGNANHPLFYFFLSGIIALYLVAPSGESNMLGSFQSLLVYLIVTTSMLEGTEYFLFSYIPIISLYVLSIVIIVGSIISIISIFELMKEGNLNKEALRFRKVKTQKYE